MPSRSLPVGRELYDRVRVFATHLTSIGGSLQKAVGAYNSAVGSLESRVLPQGRKLKEVAALPDAELPDMHAVEIAPREIHRPRCRHAPAAQAPRPPPLLRRRRRLGETPRDSPKKVFP